MPQEKKQFSACNLEGMDRLLLKKKEKAKTQKFTNWTAGLLIILLVVYYIVTLANTIKIADQVEQISEHPFPVSIAAGKVDTCAAQLRTLPERLVYMRSPEVIEAVRRHIDEIDSVMTENLDFISQWHLTNQKAPELLQETYQDLRVQLSALLTLADQPDADTKDINSFYTSNVIPLLDEIDRLGLVILDGAQKNFVAFEQLAGSTRLGTIVFATVLMLAVLTALGIYLYIIRTKNRQEQAMQDALREALASAQNANDAKSRFLSNMSHDIRTPMNAIIGMTAIAGMNLEEPAKVKDCLNKISVSSKHLLGLINDVLDMSKIESGKITLNNEEFLMPELIQGIAAIVQQQAKAKQLDLDISISGLDHERVVGDTLRINQMLLNIVGNAVKFTPSGGQVTLKIRELPPKLQGYGCYRFIISDTGIGIPEDFLDKIFQPFERVGTSTQSKIEGTGLGMAITKSIVDMMGGQISVESELGKGTTFQVTLHLKLQKGEEQMDFSALRELRTLVVDDDQDVCEDTARMLREIGMESEWVLTGREAVEKTVASHEAHRDYHSVILDWKMPEMDGLETARQIRNKVGDEVPIIILTAYDWSDIEEEAKQAGVNAFLAKPLFKSRLYHVLRDVITAEYSAPEEDKEPDKDLFEGRVLLVEDNVINMEIAEEFLNFSGVTVENAWDGQEALQMISDAPDGYYSLVFMDLQMPRMNGYDATRRIRQMEDARGRGRTPIVAMSANAFVEDVDKAYASGMDAYLTKPVNIDEIRGVLREYLG